MIGYVKKGILLMRMSNQPTGNKGNVYVIQDIPGSKIGVPKINIIGATQFGNLKVCLPENSQHQRESRRIRVQRINPYKAPCVGSRALML